MRKNLLKAGLIVSPLAGLFCFAGFIAVQAFNEGTNRPSDVAMHYAHLYGMGLLLSILAFVACLIFFIKSGRKPRGLR